MKKKLIVGITVTMFLVTMIAVAFPARVSAYAGQVKIGIVGPKGWIQWDGLWEGAQIARDLINDKGGIVGPDGRYEVVLVDIDEHAVPTPDPAAAIAELLAKLTAHPDMLTLIGGFRTECVQPMEEKFLDYCKSRADAKKNPPIWIIAGAATDALIAPVRDPLTYERYKYMFRVTPLNSTVMFQTFLFGPIKQLIAPKLAQLYYGNASKLLPTYIIAENLAWCDTMVLGIKTYGATAGLDVKGDSRPSAVATDFSSDFAKAEAAGAKLVIHIFSAVAGANFIKQYGIEKRKFALIGINVESQMQDFYTNVGGLCEYESFLASVGTRTNLNPYGKPLSTAAFWDEYKKRFGHYPIYTAWGSADGIFSLNETSYDPVTGKGWMKYALIPDGQVTAKNITDRIKHTETLGVSDGFTAKRVIGPGGYYYRAGLLGLFKYTGPNGEYHDPYATSASLSPLHDGVIRAFIPQWQAGKLEILWPRNQEYSRKWIIPSWMYSLTETDFAGGPLISPGYPTPDRTVGVAEMAIIGDPSVWFKTPPLTLLEADMSTQDHFINIYDAAKVGMDYAKSAIPA